MPTELPVCAHCGLPVPPARVVAPSAEAFCCDGCASVHAILVGEGLDRWYALRDADARADRRAARTTGATFDAMDDPAYASVACRERPDGLREVDWVLEGVHCAACVWLVERLPRLAPGVVEARLDLPKSRLRLTWDPARTALSSIARRLDRFGYPPHPFRGARAEQARRAEERRMLVRLGITGACASNVMAIAFALWGGILGGMEREFDQFFRWASVAISLPALYWGGGVFFRGAWNALRARTLHMDVPIALGITGGFAHGVVNTIRGGGVVYFDSVTALIFLLLAGRWVQMRQQRRAADSAELLVALAPSTARRVEEDGIVREVPVEALLPGMRVEVRAGETFPADGVVAEGRTSVDRSLLTGESHPQAASAGDEVHAGTLNLAARVLVAVRTTGEATRVGRLMRLVEEHAARRAPIVQLADRISGVFVAIVLVLAALTALLWLRLDPARAFDHTIALLIVTCPCALGLATPLAVGAAVGQAARAGILIKGGDALERLSVAGRMWLDKTGTLTEGNLAVVAFEGDRGALRLAAALETHSSHPTARALAAFDPGAAELAAVDVVETRGGGIEGRVAGRKVLAGSIAFVRARGVVPDPATAARLAGWARDGRTPVVVALDGRVAAAAALGDRPREGTEAALARIRALGFRTGLLSGDHPDVAASVARRLGFEGDDVRAGATPEDKLEIVRAGAKEGPVFMVGDGVNDAAALAAATVGIAVHGGAEAALEAADVYVNRAGLGPVVEVLEGSRRAMAVVRRNLAFSFAYNALGVVLAMAGWINPLVAAVLMPLSSITVIVSSYRARMFDPPAHPEPAARRAAERPAEKAVA
ncbi:MAG TPA: heavy metal translocating P-type ATPase metal-binding domain-containing protein [Candidatus Polarisedimenticolaceae bacterium]